MAGSNGQWASKTYKSGNRTMRFIKKGDKVPKGFVTTRQRAARTRRR